MFEETSSTISFDVLVRGETADVPVTPANLDKVRPPPEAVERCFRYLTQQGITCHRTNFGLACEARVELFESLFEVRVTKQQASPAAAPIFQMQDKPRPPREIENLISQVTVAPPPSFFGEP